MGRAINEIFSPRRTNRYRTNEKPRRKLDMEIVCGWFCAGVIATAGWVLIIQIARWAWRHWL